MENASRALLIAGAILIGMIIISVAVSIYTENAKLVTQYSHTVSATELQKVNSNFEMYIGRKDINPQEIITAYNVAQEYSSKMPYQITVTLYTGTISNTTDFIQDNIENKYEVYNIEYTEGQVTKLVFKKV